MRARMGLAAIVAGMLAILGLSTTLVGCANPSSTLAGPGGTIQVVAAESTWGSIAEQLGGKRVQVTSIISNPDADPHDYEPTVADARTFATADLVVYNGAGYDAWVQQLLDASPDPSRVEMNAGAVVGVSAGANPHLWYSPIVVEAVARRITQDYKEIDPANASYYDTRWHEFDTKGLAEYDGLISQIASRYAGTPIGASESIVPPLADALHLPVLTPASFMNAISQGVDPSAADKALVDEQIKNKRIKIFVYNKQNATPDVAALVAEAKKVGIPVVTITETPVPADATFQEWQIAQLKRINTALHKATGR
jgi:zinc/manganese transport system substrate-binding protein